MKNLLLLLSLAIVLTSCKETNPSHPTNKDATITTTPTAVVSTPGAFVHSVFFWLKNPTSEEDRTAFLTSLRKFIDQSPYITTQHIGTPAATHRDVIDNTYTFSLLLTFKDKAAQDAYQEEEAHQQFIAESSALWEKVLVYDSELLQK